MAAVLPEGRVFRKDVWFRETGYTPHEGQRKVHYNASRHRVLCNGRRWGKTLVGGKECETAGFIKNFLGEPLRGWIIGPNYLDCEKEFRVVYDTYKKLGIDQISRKFLRNVENGNMAIKTNWGFDLECRSAAHPESLVGEGLDFVLCVEAGRLTRKMFTEYVRPALSDKRGWSLMSGVPEIAADTSLLYWGFNRGQDPIKQQWWSIRMPSWTNTIVFPGGRNDPEILEAKDDLTEDEFDRQYGGKFVERKGRVMKEWDDDVHLVSGLEYDRTMPLYACLDYGYTNDWVMLWIQQDFWGQLRVIDEQRFKLRDTEDIIRHEYMENPQMRPMVEKLSCFYGPPAEPDDNNVVRRLTGKTVRNNTGGEINPRMSMIRSALKQRPEHLADGHPDKKPMIIFSKERCHRLAWEMREGYRWPEDKDELQRNASEIPLDKDNHGPEALSRFFKGHMERQLEATKSKQSRGRARRR